MPKKKNYDGWCAKTKEGEFLLWSVASSRSGVKDVIALIDGLRSAEKIVKVKLVEVK